MNSVYIAGDHIITSLGFSTGETLLHIKENKTGFRIVSDRTLTPSPLPLSLVDSKLLNEKFSTLLHDRYPEKNIKEYTRLEKLFILSIHEALKGFDATIFDGRTLPVISTTKGNIDLLDRMAGADFDPKRVYLWEMARVVTDFFGFRNRPLIVSNACISGVLALSLASRQLQNGAYERAVVAGGDILSEFVISGFLSFQALSPEPCKPFDAERNGLSLGEGCGTIVLSTKRAEGHGVLISGSAGSNDANHISGPSRTGEELALAISKAMKESGMDSGRPDFISAHGTATLYNDEMESKSLNLVDFGNVPVNSFKGYWGHTLGAAGILESVMTIKSMQQNMLLKSAGFNKPGTPEPMNVIRDHMEKQVSSALKVASGFGGCNAAIVFRKY